MTKITIQHYLKSDSKSLGGLLNKVAQLNRLNNVLRESLGEEAAIMDHCHVVNIAGSSLIMIADSPLWVTRLRFYIPELLPVLRKQTGLEHLKAICCKVQPGLSLKSSKKVLRNRVKLKPETADKILETSRQLKDEKIKAILEKIAKYKM